MVSPSAGAGCAPTEEAAVAGGEEEGEPGLWAELSLVESGTEPLEATVDATVTP